MDIVALSASSRSKQRQPRRHTMEVRLEHLPKWNEELSSKDKRSTVPLSTIYLAPSSELHFDDSSLTEESDLQVPHTGIAKGALTASWHDLEESSDIEVSGGDTTYYQSSQGDVLQEMRLHPLPNHLETHKHGYQLSYELALDNMLTPFASPTMNQSYGITPTTYTGHVILEISTTETTYVEDLTDIVEGYIIPLESCHGSLQLSKFDMNSLFGNVKKIKDFNHSVLHTLKSCGDSCRSVGQCFLEKADGFKAHYSHYCNNYPSSIQVLSRLQKDSSIAMFLKQLVKHMSVEDEGFTEVSFALDKMTSVSKHINEMMRYDATIHNQGLQSLIRGSEDIDLTNAGDLVLEESLRYGGRAAGPTIRGRADRQVYVFLFRKLMLMTKKEDDEYQYKMHLEMKDIQLTERVEKDANCFQVRQVSTGNYFTLQAPSHKSKQKWVKNIKLLLMESIPGLPDKAKMLIMAGFPTDFSEGPRRSPKSTHHRRQLPDDASPSSLRWDKRNESKHSQTATSQSKAKQRNRSNTSPSLQTDKLAEGTLVAKPQLEPFQEKQNKLAEKEVKELVDLGDCHEVINEADYPTKDAVREREQKKKYSKYIPTVTVTPPEHLTDDGFSDSTDQTAGGAEQVPAQRTDSSYVYIHDEITTITVPELQESVAHLHDQSRQIHDVKPVILNMKKDEEIVQLTHIDSLDSLNDDSFNCEWSEMNRTSSIIFDPPPMFQTNSEGEPNQSASVHLSESSHDNMTKSHNSSVFTDDDESLFHYLMSESTTSGLSSKSPHSASLDPRDTKTLQSLLHASQDSISEAEDDDSGIPQLEPPLQFAVFMNDTTTPQTMPIYEHSCRMKQSSLVSDTDDSSVAPTSTPAMLSPATFTKNKKAHSVVRRHSYNSQHQNRIIHRREGSKSSGNSPEGSPRSHRKEKKRPSPSKAKRQSSFTKGSISVIGLVSTTRDDLSLEDSCFPITEQSAVTHPAGNRVKSIRSQRGPRIMTIYRSGENTPSPVPKRECQKLPSPILTDEQLDVPSTDGSANAPLECTADDTVISTSLDVPFSGNPNEKLSFDEVLQSYDHYASATGKTTRTNAKERKKRSRSPSMPKREKRKKDRKRSMTVATIDKETVLAAKEAMILRTAATPEPQRRRLSKVQQLAREYSRRIKEQGGWFKRFSTVVEESPDEEAPEVEPDWLKELRKRRKSAGSSQDQDDHTPPLAKEDELGLSLVPPNPRPVRSDDTQKASAIGGLDPKESSTALLGQYADNHGSSKHLPRSQSTDYELDRIATPDPFELQRKGGLKGWVKSIVMKFGGNK